MHFFSKVFKHQNRLYFVFIEFFHVHFQFEKHLNVEKTTNKVKTIHQGNCSLRVNISIIVYNQILLYCFVLSSTQPSLQMYGRSHRSATNSSHPPVILQTYLYIRMYYNKIRKTVCHWWDAYLLFKCSITVLPIYLVLVIAGVYCIVYNIDVNASLKTVYQVIFLPLSAAVIFIFVLLLATFNGDSRSPDEIGSNADQYEVDLDSISLPSRHNNNSRSDGRRGNRCSISSSIWSAIFGNYNDEEEEEFDEDVDPSVILTMTAEEAQQHGLIPPFGHLPPSLLNEAQSQLVNSLEQTTAGIEFFLDQCNSFEQFINPTDGMLPNSTHCSEQNFLPPPGYYDSSSSTVPTNFQIERTNSESTDYQRTSILPPPDLTTPFDCHLAPAIPPTYSSSVLDTLSENNSSTFLAKDFPPTYEEAIRK